MVSDSLTDSSLNSQIDDFLASGKPVFVFFYADWCYFCKKQKPIVDELEEEYAGEIAFLRVEGERFPDAVKEFGVEGYPAMFLETDKMNDGEYEYEEFRGSRRKRG